MVVIMVAMITIIMVVQHPQETPDEIIAVADDSAIVSEPTFEEEVIEAQEDDDITGQVEAPVTKLPEEPKEEEQFVT